MSGRRDFLRWSGMTLAGLRLARGAGETPEVFAEIDGKRMLGGEALGRAGLRVGVQESAYLAGRLYTLSATNTGGGSVVLGKVGMVLRAPASGGRKRRWRVFLDQGGSGWCGVKRLDALQPDRYLQPARADRLLFHRSDLQTLIWDAESGEAMLAGFLRQRFGRNKIDVIPNRDASDVERLEAWQEFGVELAPGGVQSLDPLAVAYGRDPYAMLEQFGEAVRKHQARVFDAPPCVGMMTWYGYRTAIDEDLVLANAKIIAELFGGYPRKMQNLMLCDHGWQQDANWGYWEPDPKRFPHGMEWLAGQLARDGIALGLWITPFCLTENAPNHKELAALEALDEEGRPRRKSAAAWGDLPGQPGTWSITFLDGGKPAVQELWRRTLARMKSWGVRYWKLDFFSLQTSASESRRLGTGELYARTWKTFREAVGPEGHLAPCSCSTNLQLGYDDSVRIAADIGNAGNWPEELEGYRHGMGTVAALWYKHRKFWVNDADSIQFARGCALSEARVRATVVALSGGHLMVSEDLRRVDAARLEMIRRLLPPYPAAARPLDLFENPFPEGYPAFWALPLKTGFGPMTVLAVFNLTERAREFEILPEMLGIGRGKEFMALEWWQYRWLGRFQGAFHIEVPPLDVAVIHARPTQDVPSLLSVSHHITGGYIVENVWFDRASGTLHGELATKPGLRAVLFGHSPKPWSFAREETFHGVMSSSGAWQSELLTVASRTPFAIRFTRP